VATPVDMLFEKTSKELLDATQLPILSSADVLLRERAVKPTVSPNTELRWSRKWRVRTEAMHQALPRCPTQWELARFLSILFCCRALPVPSFYKVLKTALRESFTRYDRIGARM
jgi:hypothetical protein